MPTSICPECSEDVFVESDAEQGDSMSCEECSAPLTLVGLDPIELDLRSTADGSASDALDDFSNYSYDDDNY